MITEEFKARIVLAIASDRENYSSDNKQAVALDINNAQLSRINRGETLSVLSEAKWLSLGRRLQVAVNAAQIWHTAITPTHTFITEQLQFCKVNSTSRMLCDEADIGKTHTSKEFAKATKLTVYIDCSQVKSKQKLIRQIAREFGVDHKGKYSDVYEDLVYYLQSVTQPFIILDEAGDLDYPAFLELKALWNATEGVCAWYLIGAEGLKAKFENNLSRKKVGYTEIFSRFGTGFQKASPNGREDFEQFKMLQTALITRANNASADVQKMYANTLGSLRKIKTELQKVA